MASLGQILRQILRGQPVKQAFMQAKPTPGLKQQKLIGMSREKPGTNAALVAAKMQELVCLTALIATVTSNAKSPGAGMTLASRLQNTLSQLQACQMELAELERQAVLIDGLVRLMDQMLKTLHEGMAQAGEGIQGQLQMMDNLFNRIGADSGSIGRTLA